MKEIWISFFVEIRAGFLCYQKRASSGFVTSITPRAQLPVAFSRKQQCKLQQPNGTNLYFTSTWRQVKMKAEIS